MLPLNISYNYEIVYHRQKERESLKSPFPCCFGRFFSFLHFLMAYFSTKSENVPIIGSALFFVLALVMSLIFVYTNLLTRSYLQDLYPLGL